jgi:diguanylate cyclase (GGDEF)-like protein
MKVCLPPVLIGLVLILIATAPGAPADAERRLATATGPERVTLLLELADPATGNPPARNRQYATEALILSRTLGDPRSEAAALFALAEAEHALGETDDALLHLEEARAIHTRLGDLRERARTFRKAGDFCFFVSRYDDAVRLYLESMKGYEGIPPAERTSKDHLQIGHLYTTLGNVLRNTGDRDQAIAYYLRSAEIYRQEDYRLGLVGAACNIGGILEEMGRPAEALTHLDPVEPLARELGNRYLLSIVLTNLGTCHRDLRDFRKARAYFDESLRICRQDKRDRGILGNLKALGEMYDQRGRPADAIACYREALPLGERLGARKEMSELYDLLARSQERTGDYAAALASFRRHVELRDELLNAEKTRQIQELQIAYETEKKDKALQLLQRDQAYQELIRKAWLTGFALLLLPLALLINRYRLKSRAARDIARTNEELNAALARVEELSRTDTLTGLPNRRHTLERLEEEAVRFRRSSELFAVALADLDDFKLCNDRYGHSSGDVLLTDMAQLLRTLLRAQDFVGRWGGEEFLFIFPATTLEGGRVIAEKIRQGVEAAAFSVSGHTLGMTLTIGIAAAAAPLSVDGLLMRADEALYRGKLEGKNRVVAAAPPGEEGPVAR